MKFSEVAAQALTWLQREGRVSYRALKREFALDDDLLEDLKEELLFSHPHISEVDGRGLVWTGAAPVSGSSFQVSGSKGEDQKQETSNEKLIIHPQPPAAYTPAHLAERIRAEQAALEARGATDGECKTITALFADLKGSTALIEGLDPEEARAVIDPALQLMMDAVHRYDGYVAQALGDGIFALFGAPLAHEDHPQRALYAALRMQDAMRRYGDTLRHKGYSPLLMRVGLNTGEVVLRSIRKDDLHADYVPVGHSTNLAARMEQLATPGSIVVSAHTYRLTDGYFAFKDLGATQIKGVEEPLHIYEVLGAGPLRTRLQVSATRRGLTRFVGRQSEMEQLQRALEHAKAGHGQIVGTMGEPGLGKSRLFYEFVGAYGRTPLLVLQAYSVSHGKATAYLPVIELLKTYFRIEQSDDERTRRQRVIGRVLELDRSLEDILPYLFALLGIEEQPSPLAQMDPQIRRRRTFEALKKLFLRESLNQPLILIFEDLHWIDGETQGFLDVLSESVASAKILLLTNYRPEYRHEWGQKTYYTQLRLAPFGKAEAEEFLDALLGNVGAALRGRPQEGAHTGAPLQDLKRLILEKTQGTPFFMEEIVQDLFEQGVLVRDRVGAGLVPAHRGRPQGSPLHIPPTVQGILAARIDRLAPEEKALLQQLSVIGRQFPMSLVRQVITQLEADFYRLLASLQRKEFLYEQPAFPEPEYIFKHALTQEVAYGTVLQERRKVLHERTGQALEALYAETLPEHYSNLAHHYCRSANTQKAVEYLSLGGQQAAQRSANLEAVMMLTEAVALVQHLPATPEHLQQELRLQTALGPLLLATKGYGAVETESVYTRAYALCHQLGETSQLFPVLWGLQQLYTTRADYQKAREYGEQMLSVAQRLQDPSLLLWAYRGLGEVSSCLGEFPAAKTYCENTVALYDPQQWQAQTFIYGEVPTIGARAFLSTSLFVLGYPDRALQTIRDAVTLAREVAHANSLAFASYMTAWVYVLRRESGEARAQAEAVISMTTEQGLPFWSALGTIVWGWALAVQGDSAAGIAELRQGLTAFQTIGSAQFNPSWLALLAEAYWRDGRVEEGLATVAEALEFVDKTDERFYEAEVWRIKGELTLQKEWKVESQKLKVPNPQPLAANTQAEAEACFLKAVAIAQKQQAKSLELRAVMSLARLWQSQGKTTEACNLLAPVYNWFTEGFDTKDLQEAKALIEELSH